MPNRKQQRKPLAQSFIETVVGIIFLVPIVLFLVDIGAVILATTTNDHFAKQAARAAASAQPATQAAALTAAQGAMTRNGARTGSYIQGSALEFFAYNGGGTTKIGTASMAPPVDPGAGQVAVTTSLIMQPPVPFPFISGPQTLYAKAVEPIMALPATATSSST